MPIFTKDGTPPVFYVHVPKTAGTYVKFLFRANGYATHLNNTTPRRLGLVVSPQHYHRAIYEQLVRIDDFKCRFLTVRHPTKRLVSEFMMRESDNDRFPSWLRLAKKRLAKNPYAFDNHMRPQVAFYHPSLAVFRQEEGLGEEWARALSERFDLPLNVFQVPRRNDKSTGREPLSGRHMDLAVRFCKKVFADDFEAFGYKHTPPD